MNNIFINTNQFSGRLVYGCLSLATVNKLKMDEQLLHEYKTKKRTIKLCFIITFTKCNYIAINVITYHIIIVQLINSILLCTEV